MQSRRNGKITKFMLGLFLQARLALDQYHKQDRVNREEFFRLYKLEVPEISPNNGKLLFSPGFLPINF